MALRPSVIAAAIAGFAAVAARRWRRRHAAATEARVLLRRPVGRDGIIPGAEGFTLAQEGRWAVLLLHGAGDTPAAFRYLAADLHERGYSVHAPLLPGHGRTIREFAAVSAQAWYDAAREALRTLRLQHEWVAIAGLSMGGALAAWLGSDEEFRLDLPAIVLLAPYLSPPPFVRCAAWASAGWGTFTSYVDTLDPRSVHDAAERDRSLGYGIMTPAALRALVRVADTASKGLPRITAPTLMIQSRHDNRVPAAGAARAFQAIGARTKHIEWRETGGHILPVDRGREDVIADVGRWLALHGGVPA